MTHNESLSAVSNLLADALELDVSEIEPDTAFVEIGADSVVLAQLAQAIQGQFGLEIKVRQLFDEIATVEALAEYIEHNAVPAALPPSAAEPRQPLPSAPQPPAPAAAVELHPAVVPELSAPAVTMAAPVVEDPTMVGVFHRQLDVMSRQLELLSGQPQSMSARRAIPAPPAEASPATAAAERPAAEKSSAGRAATAEAPPPDWGSLSERAESGSRELERLISEAGLGDYSEMLSRLASAAFAYVVAALRQLGWDEHRGQEVSTDSMAERLGVDGKRRRLFARLIEMLQEEGCLENAGAVWEVAELPPTEPPAADLVALKQRYPYGQIEMSMLERCGDALAEVLAGRCDPLSLVFSAGSSSADQLYGSSPGSQVLNRTVAAVVAAALERWPANRRLHLLEIGAGTGATTACVLPLLKPEQTEYTYTDISPAFTTLAKSRFSTSPILNYQLLDIDQDPGDQGFEAHSFDLVLAANVLHATQDLRQTLTHVKQVLASGGLLVILENTSRLRWVELTFGLLDGWWSFTDTDLRSSSPLISRSEWLRLLASLGFSETAVLPPDSSHNAIILARGPVRAPAPEQAKAAAALPPWRARETKASELSRRQQSLLDELTARHVERTRKSKELTQDYRPVLADIRVSSNFRFTTKELLYPLIGHRAEGSRLWDIDGNEYIDLTMGFGVNLFGHRPPFVQQALMEQLERGFEIGPQPVLVGEVSKLISEFTGLDRVTFANSGTEAVMAALRMARAASGRSLIAFFQGSYHGHFDGTLAAPSRTGPHGVPAAPGIVPSMVQDVLVLEYGAESALDIVKQYAGQLAAVIVEPIQSRAPDFQPKAFLQELRQLTREYDIALIFDEMITGFRLHPGGAQAFFGVEADIATYGKIVGGGMPIGVAAGKRHYLDRVDGGMWDYGDDSYPRIETTFFGGTFNKHPLALAASRAVLTKLKEKGASLQQELNQRSDRFATELNQFLEAEDAPFRIANCGSFFRFVSKRNMDLLFYHLMDQGIYIWEGRTCFFSTAHSDEDIARVKQAVEESVSALRRGGFLPESRKKKKRPARKVDPSLAHRVLALQPRGSQRPLFILPGAYGTSMYLAPLARHLGFDQPLFGLHSRGLHDGELALETIEEMAEDQVGILRRFEPQGPYLLAGHSCGCLVAFEIARQLQQEGEKVALLALLDNTAYYAEEPLQELPPELDEINWMVFFGAGVAALSAIPPLTYEQLQELAPEDRWPRLLEWLQEVDFATKDTDITQIQREVGVFRANVSAEMRYKPKHVYPDQITLFRGSDELEEVPDSVSQLSDSVKKNDRDLGWGEFSAHPVEVHDVPGNHVTLVTEPHVRTLSKRLKEVIERTTAEMTV